MSALVAVFGLCCWLLSCWQVYLPLYVLFLFYLFKNKGTDPRRASAFVEGLYFGGHRGSPEIEAENTLASLEQARQEGVNAVEFDVSLTKDGVPVLLHDDTLDRTTNRMGKIREFTLEELRTCNCAAKFQRRTNNVVDTNNNPASTFQHLSTLEEIVLWAIRHKMRMFLDVKDTDAMMTDALDAIFRRYKIYDLAIVCSLYPKATYRLKRQNPQILVCMSWCRWVHSYNDLDGVMPLFNSVVWHWLAVCYDTLYVWSASTWLASFLAADFVLVERSHVCESYVRYHQSRGRQVCVWTVNDEAEMRWICHVIRIPFLTDRPYLASKVIKK